MKIIKKRRITDFIRKISIYLEITKQPILKFLLTGRNSNHKKVEFKIARENNYSTLKAKSTLETEA